MDSYLILIFGWRMAHIIVIMLVITSVTGRLVMQTVAMGSIGLNIQGILFCLLGLQVAGMIKRYFGRQVL